MRLTSEQVDLLDKYVKGLLSKDEHAAVDQQMQNDDHFRMLAEEHFILLKEMKRQHERKQLQIVMNEAHKELEPFAKPHEKPMLTNSLARKNYWTLGAMAAAIALVSITGTFFITRSLKNEQTAIYRELRRNVEQIKKSQKVIMADIADEKKKKMQGNFAGTGFLISSEGYLTTSYHVLKEADSVYIENEKLGLQKATLVFGDAVSDVAILKIETSPKVKLLPPYMIATKETFLAEEVYTLGYPREDLVFGSGSISALTGYDGNPQAYQVSVPVNPGNSGGPLFNNKGDLVGIISGKQTEASGVAFATKSTVLLQVLSEKAPDSLRTVIRSSRQTSLRSASRVEQVKQWRDYVFIVRIYKN